MVLVCAGVYPLMLLPMAAPVKNPWWRNFTKVIIVALVAFVACLLHSLGKVNIVTGAISVFIFVGLIPAIIGRKLLDEGLVKMIALCLLCFVGMVLGLMYTSNEAQQLVDTCVWRLN